MVNAMLRLFKFAGPFCCLCPALVYLGGWAVGGTAIAQPVGPPFAPSNFEHCRTIADDAARLRCYEDATSKPSPPPQVSTPPQMSSVPQVLGPGARVWRLVRTPNPAGGKEAVSIMQTADIVKSDIDLAGLTVRCGENNLETLVVLLTPLPPRAHPKVTVSAGGASEDFTGTVVPPGAEVLLPQEASALASGPWTAAPELSVQVENDAERVKGVIPLAGLGAALPMLLANCPSQ